jgi:alpha-ribazole phosphatase
VRSFLRCARHGPVALEHRCYGRMDVPAAEDPRSSAELLFRALVMPSPLVIWTSPLRRCREVAAELARLSGAALQIDQRLAEIDFGEWEGFAWGEIEQCHPSGFRAWISGWRVEAPPGGETLHAFETRVWAWLKEFCARGQMDSAAIIAHAGVIRALRVLGAGITWDEALSESVPHLVWLAVPVSGGVRR